MIVHALVEGQSDKVFLESWAPRLLKGHLVKAYPHQGKGRLPADPKGRGLLDQLEAKLRAYGNALDPTKERVLVLIDADDDSIDQVSEQLEEIVAAVVPKPTVLFRFAVEELEAFYLGDLHALKQGFPDFDQARARAYEPDSICGTWELFGEIVGDGGGNKVAWAKTMGPLVAVNSARSRSPSFKRLCAGLRQVVTQPKQESPRRKEARRAKRAVHRDRTGKRHW
jgi:hypothetical protein